MKPLFAAPVVVLVLVLGLTACATAPKPTATAATAPSAVIAATPASPVRKISPYAPAQEDLSTRGDYVAGGLYKPGVADTTPQYVPDVDLIPEPEVVFEPRSRAGNRASYSVLGKVYRVLDSAQDYEERGLASYYGQKFHGRRTSNLEVYDMNAFTAAHKTLPLPSFARVTNLDNGKSVVVRVNDRGPFHAGRVIDLSYAAAVKLDIVRLGVGRVEVRALNPGDRTAPVFASVAAPAPVIATKPAVPPPAPPALPASSLDTLVAALPLSGSPPNNSVDPVAQTSGSTGALPPGVRIATGQPTRLDQAPSNASVPVSGLPNAASAGTTATQPAIASAAVAPATTPTLATGQEWRFDMLQDGRTMTADEFEAWMQSRRVRVATGRPGVPSAAPAAASVPVSADLAAPAPIPANVAMPAPAFPMPATAGERVTLQVASFSARSNADRALALLHGAGMDDARLLDAYANGQPVWRLRVGPVAASEAPQWAARIAGLGFGPPQRVND